MCIIYTKSILILLILPFSVFSLYAHTRLVKSHILMLRRQSGTLSLTKPGHPTPSHPSLKTDLFLQSYWLCVCWGGGGGGKSERGERERTCGLSQSVNFLLLLFTYFVWCNGPCALKVKWHRKEHIIIIIIIIIQGEGRLQFEVRESDIQMYVKSIKCFTALILLGLNCVQRRG